MTEAADYAATVTAWQEHLRAGGTTPWREVSPQPSSGQRVPHASAVHLELVRRLDSTVPDFTDLADLVLGTALPGRGSLDIPLSWPEPAPHGAPAVDPAALPAEELLRLAAAVLGELVPREPRTTPVRRGHWWARRFRVSGAPVLREQVRAALLAKGWRESTRGGSHIVIGVPVVDGLAQVWAERVAAGGSASWARFCERQHARAELPKSLRTEELMHGAAGPGERLLVANGTVEDVRRDLEARLRIALPERTDLIAVDLARRVNAALKARLPQEQRSRVVARLVRRSADPIVALDIPAPHRAWAAAAGYARPRNGVPSRVPARRTLDLALRSIGRAWTERTGKVEA